MQLAAALVVAALGVVFALVVLLRRESRLAAPGAPVSLEAAALAPGDRACRRDVRLPEGTAALRLYVGTHGQPLPRFDVITNVAGTPRVASVPAGAAKTGYSSVSIPRVASAETARVCVRNRGPTELWLGGAGLAGATGSPLSVNGDPVPADLAIDPLLEPETLLSAVPTIFRRATTWAPGWVGSWTYYLLVLAGIAIAVLAVRSVLLRSDGDTAPERASGRRWRRALRSPAALLALLAFLNGAAWATLTPPWQAPDEMHHFQYVQYLAETGHPPGRKPGSPTSTELIRAMEAAGTSYVLKNNRGKPPWSESDRERWADRYGHGQPREDGGGPSSASGYSPLYYSLTAAAYRVDYSGSVFGRLFAARLVSALLGALTVLFVWLFAREVFGRRGWPVNASAAVVVLLPQFGFMSGAVNNDLLIAMLGSLLLYLLARFLRRGPTVRTSVLAGLVLMLAFLAKPSLAAFGPVTLGVLAWPALARRRRQDLVFPLAAAAAAVAVALVWLGAAALEDWKTVPVNTSAPRTFVLGDYLSYVWHFYAPALPNSSNRWFGTAYPLYVIWMHSFFAAFGWGETQFSVWVYKLIAITCAAGGLMLIGAAVRFRDRAKEWLPYAALCAGAVIPLVLLVHITFYRIGGVGEQGRYLLPLLPVFGVSVVAAAYSAGRRAPVVATALVSALGVLTVLSYGLMFVRYYT